MAPYPLCSMCTQGLRVSSTWVWSIPIIQPLMKEACKSRILKPNLKQQANGWHSAGKSKWKKSRRKKGKKWSYTVRTKTKPKARNEAISWYLTIQTAAWVSILERYRLSRSRWVSCIRYTQDVLSTSHPLTSSSAKRMNNVETETCTCAWTHACMHVHTHRQTYSGTLASIFQYSKLDDD